MSKPGRRSGPVRYERTGNVREGVVSEKSGKGKAFRLSEARELTPPVDPAEALRKDLRMAFLQGFGADDMDALAGKLKEMALSGDLAAMKLITQLLTAPAPAVVVVGRGGKKGKRPAEVEARNADRERTLGEDCADLIRLEGPLSSATLAGRCGVAECLVEAALQGDDRFERDADGGRKWHLSGKGFALLNADRDSA